MATTHTELLKGIEYPGEFLIFLRRGIVDLEPWRVYSAGEAEERMNGLAKRVPGRALVPFARRDDNDDVACFLADGSVVVLHDFSDDPWRSHRALASFHDWLRLALEDMIDFDLSEME